MIPYIRLSLTDLDLTSSDQIVDVIKCFLQCWTHSHQAMVPQDEDLWDKHPRNKEFFHFHFVLEGISYDFFVICV